MAHGTFSWPEGTIAERVLARLESRPDAVAMVDGPSGRALSGGELAGAIRRLAGGLAAAGFGAGTVTALMAPNLPDYATVFHAVLLAGGTVTTVNPTYTAPEVHHQLAASGARLLVTIPAFLDTARAAAEGTDVRLIAVIGGGDGATALADLMGPAMGAQAPVAPADVAVLPYSSGTTGLPKGVMLTHRNLAANVEQTLATGLLREGERTLAFLPFFHIYGQTVLLNCALAVGAVPVTLPRFDLDLALRLIAEHRTPRLFCVPPVMLALARHPLVDSHDLSALRTVISAAAPLDAALGEAVARRLGVTAIQGYGMTELSPVSHLVPEEAPRAGSVGRALPATEVRIVDPATGADLPVGAEGELWIRGPQVMKGYLNNPEATRQTLTVDGWLRTGDLAAVDADGYLWIRDRLKELIKVKGFQVPPAEVEAALLTVPGVADAAVTARPDDEAGEVPVAFVVASAGEGPSAEGVLAHLATRLAPYKLPCEVHVVAAIPKSPSGKILRRMLKVPV